ncbi:MAG: hypothetical protein AAB492_01745 [Patescibacteria group bacterium]
MKNERDFRGALVGISGLSALGYLIHTFIPDTPLLIGLFFVLIGITVYGWMLFISQAIRIALLTTIYVLIFFLLQLMHLRHPLYTLLLLTFIISLEVIHRKR